jgi:hypothetical protein
MSSSDGVRFSGAADSSRLLAAAGPTAADLQGRGRTCLELPIPKPPMQVVIRTTTYLRLAMTLAALVCVGGKLKSALCSTAHERRQPARPR